MGLNELTVAERLLHESVADGRPVDLSGDADRVVRASALAPLLYDPPPPSGVPGLRLRGARVTGALLLRGTAIDHPVVFTECEFDEPPQLAESTTRTLRFVRCRMPGIDLARLRLDGVLSLEGSAVAGRVDLNHAQIDGELQFSGAVIGADPAGSALLGESLQVTGLASFSERFTATGAVCLQHARFGSALRFSRAAVAASDQWGALQLANAHIAGTFTLRSSRLANPGGVALAAGGLQADGGLWLNDGFSAVGDVRFIGARLRAHLTLDDARLRGSSLVLDAASLAGLNGRGLVVEDGRISLADARLTGGLELSAARLAAGRDGVALAADGMTAAMTRLHGLEAEGGVSLRGARIGVVGLDGAALRAGRDGYALRADRARFGVLAGDGLEAEGRVSLRGTAVGGDVEFPRTRLTAGTDDLALVCDGLGAVNVRLAGLAATGMVSFDDARLTGELDLSGARLEGGDTALSAAGLVCGGVRARSLRAAGLVVFEDAHITRELELADAALLRDETGLSLAADGLNAGGLDCERLTAAGRMSVRGGELGGDLVLAGASVGTDPGGRAVTADGLTAVHVLAGGARIAGRMSLRGARLAGDLELKDARIESGRDEVSLTGNGMSAGRVLMDRMHAAGRVSFRAARVAGDMSAAGAYAGPDGNGRAFTAEGMTAVNVQFSQLRARGMVTLRNSQITSVIRLGGASLEADGVALAVSWLTAGSLWAPDLTVRGRILLRGSQVAGEVLLEGLRLTGDGGPPPPPPPPGEPAQAIAADGLGAGALRINRGRIEGEVTLRGARIVDQLDARDTLFSFPGGVALRLSLAEITGDVFLRRAEIRGVLRLAGTRVGRVLQLNDAVLDNPGGSALEAENLQAGRMVLLPERVSGGVRLSHARLGILRDDPATWADSIELDGLAYESLEPQLAPGERLDWLNRDPRGFQPQPYEQLAAHYTALGRRHDAQAVLLAGQRGQGGASPWPGRTWGRLQDVTVGYGYQPLRAATWLVLLVAVGSAVFWHSPPEALKAGESPHFNPVVYTLDLLLPIVDLGQEHAFNPAGFHQWFSYLLVAAGWVLATTIAAGVARTIGRR